MGKGFQIFLVCLLAFCVVIGAVCIIVPLVRDDPDPAVSQPVTDNTDSGDSTGDTTTAPSTDGSSGTGAGSDETVSAQPTQWELQAQSKLETMTLEEKVSPLFVVTPAALTGVDTATVAGDATRSALDGIPGVGEKRRAELRKHFGTIKAIREADVETLAAVVPRAAAQAVWEHFHPKNENV